MFELKLASRTINLKWGTYAMKLFCNRMGTGVDGFFSIIQELAGDEINQQKMLVVLESFIHAGYEYANGSKLTEIEVCEIIDECGGVIKINESKMVEYINYILSLTLTGITPLPGDGDQKKKND